MALLCSALKYYAKCPYGLVLYICRHQWAGGYWNVSLQEALGPEPINTMYVPCADCSSTRVWTRHHLFIRGALVFGPCGTVWFDNYINGSEFKSMSPAVGQLQRLSVRKSRRRTSVPPRRSSTSAPAPHPHARATSRTDQPEVDFPAEMLRTENYRNCDDHQKNLTYLRSLDFLYVENIY